MENICILKQKDKTFWGLHLVKGLACSVECELSLINKQEGEAKLWAADCASSRAAGSRGHRTPQHLLLSQDGVPPQPPAPSPQLPLTCAGDCKRDQHVYGSDRGTVASQTRC